MGTDVYLTVERRRGDGKWERVEPLVPNPYKGYFEDDYPGFSTLHGEYTHESWSFVSQDRWLMHMNWGRGRSFPGNASRETFEFLSVWTNPDTWHALLLRDLEELDWVAAYYRPWPHDPEERSRYVSSIRQVVLDRLRPLGGPDEVRLIYGLDG